MTSLHQWRFIALWLILHAAVGLSSAWTQSSAPHTAPLLSNSSNSTPFRTDSSLREGFYIGSWQDGYHKHWLVVYVSAPNHRGFAYDPPRALELCSLVVTGKTVTFGSGPLIDATSGLRYALVFKGARTRGGLHGQLSIVGGPYDGRVSTTELTFYTYRHRLRPCGQRPRRGVQKRASR